MSELYMMVTIAERSRLPDFMKAVTTGNDGMRNVTLARGTAKGDIIDLLGMDTHEKAVIFGTVTDEDWKTIKKRLENDVRIDIPGIGISFIIPLSSVGGLNEYAYLSGGMEYKKKEETTMKDTKYELLVIIANQGYSDTVMDAAKKAGARGGTVIHARGTGSRESEKFLGITLASERDMIFVVTRKNAKNGIMKSIMTEAGTDTKAGAIVFSLPVTDTAGLRISEED